MIGIAESRNGETTVPFAAHTRANTRFEPSELIRALGLAPESASLRSLLDEDEGYDDSPLQRVISDTREKWFGLVNPFSAARALADFADLDVGLADVSQIFDRSLLLPGGTPDTVMTNLGERTRAMELSPRDLIAAVQLLSPSTLVDRIAAPCPIWLGQSGEHRKDVFMRWPPPAGPRIGILTGNGPESGLQLWADIIAVLRKIYPEVPDVFMPDVAVHSVAEMGLSMELETREKHVRQVVLDGVRKLLALDCKLVTIACNTTIYFEREIANLCGECGARFVSIAEAAVPAAQRALAGCSSGGNVGLIGIGPVIDIAGEFSGYRRHLEEAGIAVTTCAADNFAFEVKARPDNRHRLGTFGKLVTTLPESTEVVILALTEASLVYREYAQKQAEARGDHRIYIDALGELGAYLAIEYLVAGYRESAVCQIRDVGGLAEKLRTALERSSSAKANAGTRKRQLEPLT